VPIHIKADKDITIQTCIDVLDLLSAEGFRRSQPPDERRGADVGGVTSEGWKHQRGERYAFMEKTKYFLFGCWFIPFACGCVHNPDIHKIRSCLKFAVISDSQGRNKMFRSILYQRTVVKKIAEANRREKPVFVLVAGDLVTGGSIRGDRLRSAIRQLEIGYGPVYRQGYGCTPFGQP
jgi:hypothetical protein